MSAPSVNLAGLPSKAGGTFAAALGGLVLVVGLSLALSAGLLLWAVFHITAVALALALPMAFVALGVGVTLLLLSRYLGRRGALARREAHEQALIAWAAQRGSCTAQEAGRAIGIAAAEADRILTDVAKREPERLALDVGDDGQVRYRPLRVPADDRPDGRWGRFVAPLELPQRQDSGGGVQGVGVRISAESVRVDGFSAEVVDGLEGGEPAEGGSTRGKRRV
jgi:hypothetical protein